MINKDYLKLIFADDKKLLTLEQLRTVAVPKYDELSVRNVYPKIRNDPQVMQYFPNAYPKGREPDRAYVFNVLNTLRPDYVQAMIRHAHTVRQAVTGEAHHQEILVSESWQHQLQKIPFLSSRWIKFLLTHL